jgi:curved DNA-binding protein CbpA
MLSLPRNSTRTQFLTAWRRFLKENHPDLNPGQSAEERLRFAEALSLWRR